MSCLFPPNFICSLSFLSSADVNLSDNINLAKCVLYEVPAWSVSNEIVAAYK